MLVDRKELVAGLAAVSKATSKKNTLPVLQNVSLQPEGNWLRLAATTLEWSAMTWVKVQSPNGSGPVTLPAKALLLWTKQVKGKEVELALDDKKASAELACGGTRTSMRGITHADFPLLDVSTAVPVLTLDAEKFRSLVSQVAFAAVSDPKDTSRPALLTVQFVLMGETLSLAATDGYRLAVAKTAIPEQKTPVEFLVPAGMLQEVAYMAKDALSVNIVLIKNYDKPEAGYDRVEFQIFGERQINAMTVLTIARFPNYEAIVPKPEKELVRLSFDKQALLDELKAVKVFGPNEERVTLTFTPAAGMVSVGIAAHGENGDQEAELGAFCEMISQRVSAETQEEPKQLQAAYNVHYLLDFLSAATADQVQFGFTCWNRPCVLYEEDRSVWQYVLMPMEINRR